MKENIWTTGLNILELISSTLSPILRDITITSKLEYLRNNGRHTRDLYSWKITSNDIWTTGLNILEWISSTVSSILRDITITRKLEYPRNNGRHMEHLFLENFLQWTILTKWYKHPKKLALTGARRKHIQVTATVFIQLAYSIRFHKILFFYKWFHRILLVNTNVNQVQILALRGLKPYLDSRPKTIITMWWRSLTILPRLLSRKAKP